jgi:hypothetical protein
MLRGVTVVASRTISFSAPWNESTVATWGVKWPVWVVGQPSILAMNHVPSSLKWFSGRLENSDWQQNAKHATSPITACPRNHIMAYRYSMESCTGGHVSQKIEAAFKPGQCKPQRHDGNPDMTHRESYITAAPMLGLLVFQTLCDIKALFLPLPGSPTPIAQGGPHEQMIQSSQNAGACLPLACHIPVHLHGQSPPRRRRLSKSRAPTLPTAPDELW